MLRHYFSTAWRHLIRNRVYSAINLLGLALGMACCVLILLFLSNEWSYDRYHLQGDRIFRLDSETTLNNSTDYFAMVGMAIGPDLKARFPEVKEYTRFMYNPNRTTIRYRDRFFNETLLFFADSQVFKVFSYELIAGDPRTALVEPRTMVLTQTLANKYFGKEEALGQTVKLNGRSYLVTGVMRDLPGNTDFPVNGLVSISTLSAPMQEVLMTDFGRTIFYTYLLFDKPTDAEGFEKKMNQYSDEVIAPFWKENSVDGSIRFGLTNLYDLHFRNDLQYDTPKGNKDYLYLFSLVATLILLIACFNYLNLAIAQSARRSVEVGIRKATGASRNQLIVQFIGEAVMLACFAVLLALVMVVVAMPVFNELAGKNFTINDLLQPELIGTVVGLVVFTGVLAGVYPAFFLARLNPAKVLKGQFSLKGKNLIRQTLVVIQFSISVGLIVGTLVIRAQLAFLQNQYLGFQKERQLVVEMPIDSIPAIKTPEIRNRLLQSPAIQAVGGTLSGLPGARTGAILMRVESDGSMKENHFNVCWIDENYLQTLGIGMAQGRNFEKERGTDKADAFIVNEAFVRQIGWDNPIGKRMQWGLEANDQAQFDGFVVGVTKDFHYASLHNPIEPLVMLYEPLMLDRLVLRMAPGKTSQALSQLKKTWKEFHPSKPLEYAFLDQSFDKQYTNEEHLGKLFTWFSAITILIACMGLFGLSSFITRQRTKEIGLRKVVGASDGQILQLIWKDFAVLVGIAIALGAAAAWFVMQNWLNGFALAVSMPWALFLLAAVLAILMALIATSYHALQAAKSPPVLSLRYE